ncbi:MAG: ATP-binding cassette domain-containing protein [Desulfovibrio sp.]|nr:ATP-binding cassette domain-containing protein [Desulfovibrio sp.]MBI4958439.1 ATP-binding cassette domain-containing protein [Desulfovibrio sp.]
MSTALSCLKAVADAYAIHFDIRTAQERYGLHESEPDPDTLSTIARSSGFDAETAQLDWDALSRFDRFPALARLEKGNTVVFVGFARGPEGERILVADPLSQSPGPFELAKEGLESIWKGQTIILTPKRGSSALRCLALAARGRGLDLSPDGLAHQYALENAEPSPDKLLTIAREQGLRAEYRRLSFEDVFQLGEAFPVLARLGDGRTVILAGVLGDADTGSVEVLDLLSFPLRREPWDRQRFQDEWDGQVMLLKRHYGVTDENQPFGLRWFIPEALRQGRTLFDVAVAAIMLSLLALALPIYFQIVIDKVLIHHSLSTLQVLSLGMLLVLGFDAAFTFLRGYLLLHATSKIDIRIATRTFSKLVSLPMLFFVSSHAGVLIQHMQQADKIREFLTGKLFFTILDSVALVVFIPALFFYSPLLASLVVGFSLVLAGFLAVLIPYFKRRLLKLYKAEGERQSFLVETIRGMETVKSLSLEPVQRKKWEEKAARAVSMRFDVGRISTSATSGVGFLEKLMSLSIPWVGVYLVFEHQMSVGALIAFQMLAGRVSAPLVQIVSLLHEYQEKALSVRMLATIMNEPSERSPAKGGLRPAIRGDIRFDQVSFSYGSSGPPALSQVSLSFPAGSVTGIVGRSGSGKSTLARLIQGLYPVENGIVTMDGHDLREFDLVHLRRHIGVVLQENFLFHGTVRDNIGISKTTATMNEIAWAAGLAGADEFISRLPQGYDTMLEENGANLSGGQKQRLAIARVLLTQPRILIFDEATSALDAESEEIIQNNLEKITRDRTTIMISHRLSMLAGADRIIVMDQGRIVDVGPHDQLVERCTVYGDLWRSQNRHVLNPGGGRPLP